MNGVCEAPNQYGDEAFHRPSKIFTNISGYEVYEKSGYAF